MRNVTFTTRVREENGRRFVRVPANLGAQHCNWRALAYQKVRALRAARRDGLLPKVMYLDDLPGHVQAGDGYITEVVVSLQTDLGAVMSNPPACREGENWDSEQYRKD